MESGENNNATGNKFLTGTNLKSDWNIVMRNGEYSYNGDYYYLDPSKPSNPPNSHYPGSISVPDGDYHSPFLIGKNSDDCKNAYGYVEKTNNLDQSCAEARLYELEQDYGCALIAYDGKINDNGENGDDNGNSFPIPWDKIEVNDIVAKLTAHPENKFTLTIGGRPPESSLEKQIVSYYELTYLRQYMDACCYEALNILSNSEEELPNEEGFSNKEQYRIWLGRFNTAESEYLVAETYMSVGDFARATEILNAMPAKFTNLNIESHQNYQDFCAVLREYSTWETGSEVPPHLASEIYRLSAYDNLAGARANSFGKTHIDGWMGAMVQTGGSSNDRCSGSYSISICNPYELYPVCNNKDNTPWKSMSGDNKIIEEKTNNEITIHPNPTTGQLIIDNGQLTISTIEMYNIVGQKVNYKLSTVNYPLTIDISHLSAGLYFLKIDGKMFKVVKE